MAELYKANETKELTLEKEKLTTKQSQEAADLLSQQRQLNVSSSGGPNLLNESALMSRRADLTQVTRQHMADKESAIDGVLNADEYKLESSKSKVRSDALKKQSGLNAMEKEEYIKEYNSFTTSFED